MDMLSGNQIAEANLAEWRKLAQGLHARYLVDDFDADGARFVAAVGEAGDSARDTTRGSRSARGTSTSNWSPKMPSTAMTRTPNTSSSG
jgi:hypothetical protein